MIQAMDMAVKMKTLLLKDEIERWEVLSDKYWIQADKLYKKISPKEQSKVCQCYQKLFGQSIEQVQTF